MTKSDLQVNFRMPAGLKAKLETAAAQNNRSTTAEVVARLEASFDEEERGFPLSTLTTLTELMGKVEEHLASLDSTADLSVKHNPDMKIPTSVKRVKSVKRSRPLGVDPKP